MNQNIFQEINKIKDFISQIIPTTFSNFTIDPEAEEYSGANFKLNNLKIKFRKAKITPKKTGQFVTLWKRNHQKITEPFTVDDDFDFCIILTEEIPNLGFFIFPKNTLAINLILSTKLKGGKRGFRVYPNWAPVENKQAEKTKSWQSDYFIDIRNFDLQKFKSIIEI